MSVADVTSADPRESPLGAVVENTPEIPLLDGRTVPYANFDHAASTPVLQAVRRVVDDMLPWYASIHRGAGIPSQVCSEAYERARDVIRSFVGARAGSAVVITRNTTDALNLLAHALPRSTSVVVFETEHHAALLPWRGRQITRIEAPDSPAAAVAAARSALAAAPVGPRLLCVTGASNVTGECWPLAELAAVAHAEGARMAVDAAQLAPHRNVNAAEIDADYVALSGHKLHAPYGAGALVGRTDWLQAAPPYLLGGGATTAVGDRAVSWARVPERHEAGSPNVLGAVAMAAACDVIGAARETLVPREEFLLHRLRQGLHAVPGLHELQLWPGADRVGLTSFTLTGWDGRYLAAALSAEYGIGVRAGAFCAHPFVRRLLAGRAEQTAVRASIGIGTSVADVDRLVAAVDRLARYGTDVTYRDSGGRVVPEPDPRIAPDVRRWVTPVTSRYIA